MSTFCKASLFCLRWLGLVSLVALLTSPLKAVDQAHRPNILYIFTDDQSVRTLSCYPQDAYPWVKTPNIDALAASGVRFHSVYMAPYCVPSRISTLTGNLPHACRGTFQGAPLQGEALEKEIREHPFWPQRLRESGYRTGIVGKWHIYSRPPAVGIDWDSAIYWTKHMANACYYGQKVSVNGQPPVELGGYSVDRHTDLAIEFIREHPKDARPWFLWLCYSGVHMPAQPAERHLGQLAGIDNIPEPASMKRREGKPAYVRDLPHPPWNRIQSAVRKYHECVMAIDENVGRLVQALRDSDQLKNTVVIFASDQGIAYGQHGLVHRKNAPYDAALRSPLIVSWPGHFAEAGVSMEPVNAPDIARTLLDISGVEALPSMDGMSLLPLLREPAKKLGREVMLMTNVQNDMGQNIPKGIERTERFIDRGGKGEGAMRNWAMIRCGDYKYVAYCSAACEEELYNVAEDPEELVNLANGQHDTVLKEMRVKAANALRATQSGFDGGHFIDFFPILKSQPR